MSLSKIVLAAALGLAVTAPTLAVPAFAQDINVRVGDRDHDRDRGEMRDHDRGMHRGEMREHRMMMERRHMHGCRTVTVRRHTPHGMVIKKMRTCR